MAYQFQPPPDARRIARQSWYKSGGMSPALQRARAPFTFFNMVIGVGLAGFIGGVYTFTLKQTKQEDFSDVVDLPVEERRKAKSLEDETREAAATTRDTLALSAETDPEGRLSPGSTATATATTADNTTTTTTTAALSSTSPEWYTSMRKQGYQLPWTSLLATGLRGKGADSALVQGAPNVDRVGKVGDRVSEGGKRLV
jgi:hypothetical protein